VTRLDLASKDITSLSDLLTLSLPHLVELNLARNRISSIPRIGFIAKNLEVLDLSYNRLEELPDGFVDMENKIRCLKLEGNRIGTLETITRLRILSTSLTSLSLQRAGKSVANPVCENPHYGTTILAVCPHLEFLDDQFLMFAELLSQAQTSMSDTALVHLKRPLSPLYNADDVHTLRDRIQGIPCLKSTQFKPSQRGLDPTIRLLDNICSQIETTSAKQHT